METRLGVLVLLGVLFVSGGVVPGGEAKDAKAELKKFEGTWAVESARERGQDAAQSEIRHQGSSR